MSDNRFHEIK